MLGMPVGIVRDVWLWRTVFPRPFVTDYPDGGEEGQAAAIASSTDADA